MTHTPGPWIIRKAGELSMNGEPHPFDFVEVAIGRFIVTEGRSEQEANANTRLIAAAPDMLAALKAILDETGGIGGPFTAARAAIAKATGE